MKRTVDMENELVDCNVAKERLAMFKNLVNGSQSFPMVFSADSKIRVDVSRTFSFAPFCCFLLCHIDRKRFLQGFRWHVKTCQPMNSSTMKRKNRPVIVGVS